MRATRLIKIIFQELALFNHELRDTFLEAVPSQELDPPNQV
jgi:hypothetical protein